MTDRPRITPSRYADRDPAPPQHDGPDERSAARLDGAAALLLAYRRRRIARLALGERPARSARRPGMMPTTLGAAVYADADIDDGLL